MEIRFRNVTLLKNQGCCIRTPILYRVNFKITKSGIYSFLGNSKSGKSSICELISFLVKPTYGTVTVDKYNSKSIRKNYNKLRFNIGYVFEDVMDMFVTEKVADELEFGLKYFNYKYKVRNRRIIDSLKLVGLDDSYLEKKLHLLSLADARKVALASVLTFNPKILLLDEPTIGLNYKEKKDLMNLLKILRDKYNKIIIVMSKDSDFVYNIADYVYIMNNGKIVIDGTKDIMNNEMILKENHLAVPKSVAFINECIRQNHRLSFRDNAKDIAKEVYRDVK